MALAVSALIALALILIPHEAQHLASHPMEGRLDDVLYVDSETATEVTGIDWDYWRSVNPAIAAWVTIPGTPIDYPIVQADAASPTHYLNYDIYNNYNIYGCLYIDCSSSIDAAYVIIFGHNMGGIDDGMFTALTSYLDEGYLKEHETVIIQTPDGAYLLKARVATEVSPYGFEKQTAFSNVEGLREYYLECWQGAMAKCEAPEPEQVDKLLTLITCDRGGATRAIVLIG
jgi:sortase B